MSVQLSQRAHAAILLRVAARTVEQARDAWRTARASPGRGNNRAAFRACVLAARCTRKAAQAYGHDQRAVSRLTVEADRLAAAADEFKAKL